MGSVSLEKGTRVDCLQKPTLGNLGVRLGRGRALVCEAEEVRDGRKRALGVVQRRRGWWYVSVVDVLLGSVV